MNWEKYCILGISRCLCEKLQVCYKIFFNGLLSRDPLKNSAMIPQQWPYYIQSKGIPSKCSNTKHNSRDIQKMFLRKNDVLCYNWSTTSQRYHNQFSKAFFISCSECRAEFVFLGMWTKVKDYISKRYTVLDTGNSIIVIIHSFIP